MYSPFVCGYSVYIHIDGGAWSSVVSASEKFTHFLGKYDFLQEETPKGECAKKPTSK
jgi:hypothetical protein